MSAESYQLGQSGTVYGLSYLRFRLFEADGVTPVQILNPSAVQNTPEPASGLLSALALSALLLVTRNRV